MTGEADPQLLTIPPDRLEKLYEELEPDGWLGPNDEDLFLSLRDPYDIKKVADRLDEVGRNLL